MSSFIATFLISEYLFLLILYLYYYFYVSWVKTHNIVNISLLLVFVSESHLVEDNFRLLFDLKPRLETNMYNEFHLCIS